MNRATLAHDLLASTVSRFGDGAKDIAAEVHAAAVIRFGARSHVPGAMRNALQLLSSLGILALPLLVPGCDAEDPEPRSVEIADFCEEVETPVKDIEAITAERALEPGEIVDYGEDTTMFECSPEDFEAYLDAGGGPDGNDDNEFRFLPGGPQGGLFCLSPFFNCCPFGYQPKKSLSPFGSGSGWVCAHQSPYVPDINIVNW